MRTDKPLVSVLLAAYKPNEEWFREQLVSINHQDYPNIELIIWDDCPENPFDEKLVVNNITKLPYTVFRGDKNMGSNFAFEELTKRAKGSYIAYCDHDDIWCENKISVLVDKLEQTGSPLVCCDVRIIDADGNLTGNSIKDAHKRHNFREGEGLAVGIVSANFIMGCASLVTAEVAKKALPFPREFIHDHWIAITAAFMGRIEVVREPLLYHRKHGGNQTGVLAGITDKQSYYNKRILVAKYGVDVICKRLSEYTKDNQEFAKLCDWVHARARYFKTPNRADFIIMGKYSHLSKHYTLFEKYTPFMPNFAVKMILKLLQKGVI